MKKFFLFSAMAFLCFTKTFSQCVTFQNPSFAGGIEGNDSLPPGWTGCIAGYEYTFPYENDDTLHAYHYLEGGFVGLYYSTTNGVIQGAISQKLVDPLMANSLDTFSIALADIGMNGGGPDKAECLSYGGKALCDSEELLYTVTSIPTAALDGTNYAPEWTVFNIVVTPTRSYEYITIMV